MQERRNNRILSYKKAKRAIGKRIRQAVSISASLISEFDRLRENTVVTAVAAEISLVKGQVEHSKSLFLTFLSRSIIPQYIFKCPFHDLGTSCLRRATSGADQFIVREVTLVDGVVMAVRTCL